MRAADSTGGAELAWAQPAATTGRMARMIDRMRISEVGKESRRGLPLYSRRWAKVTEWALFAPRRAGDTDLTSVLDKKMCEERPLFPRKERHQVLLDLHWIGVARQREPLSDARDMRVDDNALVALERVAENDIRRLSPNTGEVH